MPERRETPREVDEHIDASKTEAELRDGVLTVHVMKGEHAKSRKIEVKAA